MSQFLYFLPGVTAAAEKVKSLGLGVRLGGIRQGQISAARVGSGADAKPLGSGTLISTNQGTKPPMRFEADWNWRPVRDDELILYWLGFDPNDPPGPDDLLRETAIDGAAVKLRDGRDWIVPAARLAPNHTRLPMVFGVDADGFETCAIDPAHEELWEVAGQIFEDFLADAQRAAGQLGEADETAEVEGGMTYDRALDVCAMALGTNYRLDRPELLALELLGSREISNIHLALCDWAGWMELSLGKKKRPDETASSSGGED